MAQRNVPADVARELGIGPGLTLVQHPVSPFCIAIRLVLEAAGVPHRLHDTVLWDRRPVIALTGGAYYSIPVLVDGESSPPVVVYEARDESQDIARYVDSKYRLGLFPPETEGLQDILVQYIEGQIEDVGFRLNDIEFLPGLPDVVERTMYIRHKERKFGRGCLEQWRAQRDQLLATLTERLTPLDRILARQPYLLGDRPRFADYALHGVLGNYTFTEHNALPAELTNLVRWYAALPQVRLDGAPSPGTA